MKRIIEKSVESKILFMRGQKVMLDRDLAELYGIETKVLKRQVRRNLKRFPKDFMFELTEEEIKNWRCQFGTSNLSDKMGLRYAPFAFTEHGVLMLSSVLNSEKAIEVNIQITRAFVRLRQLLQAHKGLLEKIKKMELKYDYQFRAVFDALREIMTEEEKPKRRIGFH